MNAEKFCKHITPKLRNWIYQLQMHSKCPVLQQDNTSSHAAEFTQEWFEDANIEIMEWPPQSPDLNLIENIWDRMKDWIGNEFSNDKIPARRLRGEVENSWMQGFQSDLFGRLIDSMPARIEAVIAAEGGPTRY